MRSGSQLNGIISLHTAVIGGTTFLFAAGAIDGGISVFSDLDGRAVPDQCRQRR